MHSHLHLLRNTKVIASKDTHPLKMELDSKLRENLATQQQQPFFVPENYMKPYMKDHNEFPFETTPPNSKNTFLQDFHYVDQFHENVSSSNPMFGGQTACYVDSFDNNAIPYGCSSTNLDFYECKPYVDNGGHGQVMDNFQSGGYLNMTHRNSFDMMGSDRYQMNLDFQELKPVKFVVPDEVSCVSTAGNGYYKKVGMNNKNNRALASTRRTWKCRKKNNVVKGQWTIEEDRLLIQLVEKFGVRKWSHIAQVLPGRIGKQCRERWHNHLRPDIKKDTWSEEEDKVLIQAHVEIGNKWAEIAKRLPGRTENSIKNHWNATKRRQFSKRKCRSKYPRGSLLQDYIKSLNLDSSTSRYQQKASSATDTTMNAPNQQPQELDFCSSDRLVPNYDDFSEVPDFDFDEKLFQETCSIDSLLDEIPCATVVDEKDPEMEEQVQMPPLLEFEVKKELDLVEMISQSNL